MTYQKIFDEAKSIIKEDVSMKFYVETRPLYIETDVLGIGLGAALLQTGSCTSCSRYEEPDTSISRPIAFVSKGLSSAEKRYSNIERETLVILYNVQKLHPYCFARDVSIITYHKPLVARSLKKNTGTLSQRLQ